MLMSMLQPQSKKINKRSKNPSKKYQCSQCEKSYGSYPTLYLHTKQKHNGTSQDENQTHQIGRPKKPREYIDEVTPKDAKIEAAHNDLMWFLVERMPMIKEMAAKEELDLIQTQILKTCEKYPDEWMSDLCTEAIAFIAEYKQRAPAQQDLDFEEEFKYIAPSKSLRVLVWLMMWLGKVYVRIEFIPDLYIIFSRIWRALEETKLGVDDLDNKLVWKKVMKDCEEVEENLSVCKGNLTLVGEFIEKVCRLVGNVFEEE